jgi:acetylornithine deacetylase/succinyl-diaminopimelate desuccinylase-like protein
MTLYEAAPLIHSANERVPVADLSTAADFFVHAAREICGTA